MTLDLPYLPVAPPSKVQFIYRNAPLVLCKPTKTATHSLNESNYELCTNNLELAKYLY